MDKKKKKTYLSDHSSKAKCKDPGIFMSCLLNNWLISPCLTLSSSLFLAFTDSVTWVSMNVFIPELQAYRRASACSLLRRDITFTRQNFYEANFMSLSVVAEKERFQSLGRISFTPAPPQNIWLPPTQPRTEMLQLLLNLDWTAGQGSQLQPQHQVSKQSFTKERGEKKTLQIKLRMCRIQTGRSEHTSLIIAFLNNKHVDGCSATEERVT